MSAVAGRGWSERGEVSGLQAQLLAEGADLVQGDPVAQQHELLVSEIESTDGHLGTALRLVAVTKIFKGVPKGYRSVNRIMNSNFSKILN